MRKIFLTIIVTLLVLIGGFYFYISSGAYEISQLTPHNALTKKIISITTHSSIKKSMKDVVVPANLKDTMVIVHGFIHYNQMCKGCHGAPGVKPDEMTEGLYPKPPELFKRSHEEEAQEFFWITKNGVKLTSMPAYGPTHSDEDLWAITAFVTQKLSKITAAEYYAWAIRLERHDKTMPAITPPANE